MKNLKILIFIAIGLVFGVSTQTAQSQNYQLNFPDKYFQTSTNGNPLFKTNISDIYFTHNGNDGYGLFFLGTGRITNTTLKLGSNTIVCTGQINGYYTTNFTDFGMFPLDQNTANSIHDTGINFITGGLFYNCKKNSTIYTGIYGYIKWTYGGTGNNLANTGELRAGLNDSHNDWRSNSPMRLVYSTNFWNTNRGISGTFLSNLVSGSTVIPRFVRDVGIENGILTGTNSYPYYIVEGIQFANNGLKIYAKTERPGISLVYKLTGFDINGQQIYSTGFSLSTYSQNPRKPYGFYGYSFNIVSYVPLLASGYMTVKSGNTLLKTIGFVISGADGNFHIEYNPETNICSTGRTAIISGAINPAVYLYQRGYNTNWLSGQQLGYIKHFPNERSGQAAVKLGSTIITGNSLFVDITNIDITPPNIAITYDPEDPTLTPKECLSGYKMTIRAEDTGCANTGVTLVTSTFRELANGNGYVSLIQTLDFSNSGYYYVSYTAKDRLENEITGTITFNVQNIPITGRNFIRSLRGNPYTTSGNRKTLTHAHAGECETDSITARIPSNSCQHGIISIHDDRFTYTGNNGNTGYDECRIEIGDGDGRTTVIGRFYDCNNPYFEEICKPHAAPEIISGINFVEYENFTNSTKKYTSGSNVIVQLNAEGIDEISGYRASCIQQEIHCIELTGWTPLCYNNSDFCANLNIFIESLQKQPQICHRSEDAWSERKNYAGTNDIFSWDLENSSGCQVYSGIPYGSRDQGPRKVRVEVQDIFGRKSGITGTIIPVNYTTKPPILTGTFVTTTDITHEAGMYQRTDTVNTTQYANQGSFTTTIIANGATLQNGTSGLNYKHKTGMQNRGILWTSGSSIQKLLYFDNYNEWIISVYGNQ